MTKILVISTTTHELKESASLALTSLCVDALAKLVPHPEVRLVDAARLHIVDNLGCYAKSKQLCGSPKAGEYRCWANKLSKESPESFGGVDEMDVIYEGMEWCDILLFVTSNRWGNHTAVAQKVLERLNNIENIASVYRQATCVYGKKLGVIVTGRQWETARIGTNLLEVFRWFGFATEKDESNVICYQRSRDEWRELPDDDKAYVEEWASSPTGKAAIQKWAKAVVTGSYIKVPKPI